MALTDITKTSSKQSLLFDIVTINYNNRSGLLNTIESLKYLKASLYVGKKILVDGNSSDLTDSDFVHFSYHFDIIIREPDSGIYDAMNKGVNLSSSPHVLMLNSGDTLLKECNYALESVGQVSTKQIFAFPWRTNSNYYFPKSSLFLYFGNCCYCHQTLLLPSDIMYSRKYRISGDLELLLRALHLGYTIKHIRHPLSNYEGGGVSSHRGFRKLIEKTNVILSWTPFYLLPIAIFYNVLLLFKFQKVLPILEPLKASLK